MLRRTTATALAAAFALSLAACGERATGGSDPEVVIPEATATAVAPDHRTMDGYLLSADDRRVVLETAKGRETFLVAPEDLQIVGIPHLASHAGLTDVGFRIFYETEDGEKYIKSSQEIPPPPLD